MRGELAVLVLQAGKLRLDRVEAFAAIRILLDLQRLLLDLKAQYAQIRDEVRPVIDEVCESQMCVMGPHVKALEEEGQLDNTYFVFTSFFERNNDGQAAVLSISLFFIVLVLTLFQMRFLERRVHYGR